MPRAGHQIFCISCLSFLFWFCSNKLSWCLFACKLTVRLSRQSGKQLSFHPGSNHTNTSCLSPDYCIHPGPWNPFPLLHDVFQASSCQSICLQQQLRWWCRVNSSYGTRLHRRWTLNFKTILPECLASSMATQWAGKVHWGFVWTSPAAQRQASLQMRWVQQGCAGAAAPSANTSSSCASSRGEWCLPSQQASYADPRLQQVRVQELALAILRLARVPCRALLLLSQAAGSRWKIKLLWAYPNCWARYWACKSQE